MTFGRLSGVGIGSSVETIVTAVSILKLGVDGGTFASARHVADA